MKDVTKNIIKAVAIVLAFTLIVSSIFILRSCSAPPDYEEIRARVEELIEKSFDVNDIVWGNGLQTYERVYSPTREFYESGKTYVDVDGKEQPLNYYYYYLTVENATIVAFRAQKDLKAEFRYAFVASQPTDSVDLASRFPLSDGMTASEEFYSEIYADSEKNTYVYLIPFYEPTYEFYYLATDSADYDYVRTDSKYASVDAINDYVRTVYASSYAESLEQVLFEGVTIAEGAIVQKARYCELSSSRGVLFASLNTYEPLFTERRVYLYDTARIDRSNSNDSSVVVEFSTYLPSNPDKIETASLCFVLDNGTWYLASPTY